MIEDIALIYVLVFMALNPGILNIQCCLNCTNYKKGWQLFGNYQDVWTAMKGFIVSASETAS